MRTLIIHHLESIWEEGYKKNGTDFETLCFSVVQHIEEVEYDRVILTRFENPQFEDAHHYTGLSQFIDEVQEYGYGWDGDCVLEDEEDEDWVEGGEHSEFVWLAPWMRTLNGDVDICGAFDFECIEDLEIALRALEIKFNRIEKLIV